MPVKLLVFAWTYDENNNLLALLDGDADYDLRLYSYDAAGRPRVFTDQQGDTITNVCDMANRLLEKQYVGFATGPLAGQSDEDVFEYDAASRMVKATRNRYAKPFLSLPNIGNIACDFAYDNASRPISETLTTRGQSYTCTTGWDLANRKTQITYPDGSIVDRVYTDRNQLSQVQYQSSVIDTRTYDNGMRLQSCTSGNGIATNYTYRADNLTSSITRTGLSGADFTYDYDENKNKTQETISGVMSYYGFNSLAPAQYDDEDRLISWNRDDGSQDQSWNLSLVGDWDSFTEQAVTETRSHSGVHELESITGGSIPGGLSYDSKGNLITHSNGHDYVWDFDNKLTLATVSSGEPGIAGTHSYTYDALGRRVSKTVGIDITVFVCSGQQVLAEYVGGTAATSPSQQYVYGSYVDEPILMDAAGTKYYYHSNNLFSVTALTDSSGVVIERYAYDAYGTPTILDAGGTTVLLSSSVNNPYLFTGRRLDEETTLYYYRARYHDASLGRFLGRDPIGYVDGMSLYRAYFVPNSVDPKGLMDPVGGGGVGSMLLSEAWRNQRIIDRSDLKKLKSDFKKYLRRFEDRSPCVARETGLSSFFRKLIDLMDNEIVFRKQDIVNNLLGGEASADENYIYLRSFKSEKVDKGTLLHEVIHVYDYHNDIYLREYHDSWIRRHSLVTKAENLAYGMTEFLTKLYGNIPDLTQYSKVMSCDTLQQRVNTLVNRIDSINYEISNPSSRIALKFNRLEYTATSLDFARLSKDLGLDFSCKVWKQCIPNPKCCPLNCPSSDYSWLMKW